MMYASIGSGRSTRPTRSTRSIDPPGLQASHRRQVVQAADRHLLQARPDPEGVQPAEERGAADISAAAAAAVVARSAVTAPQSSLGVLVAMMLTAGLSIILLWAVAVVAAAKLLVVVDIMRQLLRGCPGGWSSGRMKWHHQVGRTGSNGRGGGRGGRSLQRPGERDGPVDLRQTYTQRARAQDRVEEMALNAMGKGRMHQIELACTE